MEPRATETLIRALVDLIAKRLDSVVFVLDYVQLNFGKACLTVLTDIDVDDDRGTFTWQDACSRDAVCRRIGSMLTGVVAREQRIVLRFHDGAHLSFSVAADARSGPEAVNFDDGEGKWYVV